MKGVMIFLVLTLVVLMAEPGECLGKIGQIVYGNNYQHGSNNNNNNNGYPWYGARWQRSLPGSEDDGSK